MKSYYSKHDLKDPAFWPGLLFRQYAKEKHCGTGSGMVKCGKTQEVSDMKAVSVLPEGYREIYAVDLQKDKKKMLLVNAISVLIMVIMFIPGQAYVSVMTLFDMSQGFFSWFLRYGVMMAGLVVYMVLHELVHGIAMKYYGAKKVKYGFTGMYAFAASDDYYPRKPYIVIALAPIVVWGIVLGVISFLVPVQWFWIVYFIQIGNVSGAAGDLYVTWKFSHMPEDILVRDYGVGMIVYSASK